MMKKLICILLASLLLITGCQLPEAAQETQTPQITQPAPSEIVIPEPELPQEPTSVQYTQKQLLAISMIPVYDYSYGQNHDIIFRYTKQEMDLYAPDTSISSAIVEDFKGRLEEYDHMAKNFRAQAESLYNEDSPCSSYYCDVYYSPTRIDREVLCLSGCATSFVGDRPAKVDTAINYSLLTGEVLTLGSILEHIDTKKALVDLVIQQATDVQAQLQLFDDYAACIEDRFDREESFDEDWYFTDSGLCFYFMPYEIAPYASGTVRLEVPYNHLSGIIADDFFPPEEEIMIGSLRAQCLSEADLSSYTQVHKISIDPVGESFLLFADGAIFDIQIQRGYWNEDGTVFTPEHTVFACNSLTPGDGIVLQADIPDALPNLSIQYRSGNETVKVYLSQSGMDGSAILM